MKRILETERLFLREMDAADLPSLRAILQDPIAMAAYEHAFSEEEVQDWLNKQRQRYKDDGFGLWAVVLKATDEMIGQCGLTLQDYPSHPDKRVVEVGYLFRRAFWHQGYATEAAIACRNYAFETLGVDEVYSIIRDTNAASRNVALRGGMERRGTMVKHYYHMDMPHDVFSIRKDAR